MRSGDIANGRMSQNRSESASKRNAHKNKYRVLLRATLNHACLAKTWASTLKCFKMHQIMLFKTSSTISLV